MNGSSTRVRSRRSVLLRMAKDQARAERIKALKDEHPEVTWEEIANFVGVTPRAANEWGATGGISATNARKLAEFFDASFDLLYHGPREGAPDLMGALGSPKNEQLDRIEDLLNEILSRLPEPDYAAEALRIAEQAVQKARDSNATAGRPGRTSRRSA